MDLIVAESPEAIAERLASDFAQAASETLSQQNRFAIALSGGVSPKAFFTRLTQEPYKTAIPWSKLRVFWGDERCVPPDHPESNFGMAREYLLRKVPIPGSQVFRIRGEDPPATAARAYSKILHDTFGTSREWPEFDLILLGMGADGHIASLMPGTAALTEERRWVVENVVRSLQTVRVTLTLPVINQARRAWFLVTGARKSAAFARTRRGPAPDCPASLVQPQAGGLRWYVDRAVLTSADSQQSSVISKRL